MKLFFQNLFAVFSLLGILTLTGCGSARPHDAFVMDSPKHLADLARLRVGQTVVVAFSGAPTAIDTHTEVIKEDGTITLPLIGKIYAVGKTIGELQTEIYADYVPKYYVRLTVTVSSGDMVYYVAGEVRSPGVETYRSDITLTKAIQAAGGLSEYASSKKIWITHAGKRVKVDYLGALQDPSKDVPIFPEDQILVGKSIF